MLQLTYDYNQTMQGQNLSLTLNPGFSAFFFATPSTTINVTIDPTNNLPAVVYDNSTYEIKKNMGTAYKAAVYSSYGVLLLGFACDKVIGVELFGVLQLAYLSISDLNSVQPLLSPLMNMSIVNGLNIDLSSSTGSGLPKRVSEIGYNSLLLNNFNIMLGLMLANILIASGILAAGSFIPVFFDKSRTIAKHMLKEYLLMMVSFNSFNIAYSVGLEVAYSDSSSPLFAANIAVAVISVLLPLAVVGVIMFSEAKEFGEFTSHYRKDPICQGYFIVTLLYRTVLGASMSRLNEFEDATIANVFYAILFMMYLLSNRPYKKAYQNYRAVLTQATGLVILCVTMYYRSMRSNTDPAITYQILSPAFLEVAMIFLTLGASVGCLFYELYLKYAKGKPATQPKAQDNPIPIFGESQINITENHIG